MNDQEQETPDRTTASPPEKLTQPTWTDIRRKLARADLDYAIGIVKMLFDQSRENRTFLISRLYPNADWSELLERQRKRILGEFYTRRGIPRNPRISNAREAIDDYRRATSDPAGTAELMLTYVEVGTEFAVQFGMRDAPFLRSLETVLDKLVGILAKDERLNLVERFRERLQTVVEQACDCGYGYDEFVSDRLADLGIPGEETEAADLSAQENPKPDN
jgi:hypothetical protein